MPGYMRYVLGFVFNHDLSSVLLLRKGHPDWQAGKLNGIGGQVEGLESICQAMVREAREEIGLIPCSVNEWDYVCTMTRSGAMGFQCDVFRLILDEGENLSRYCGQEDEPVELIPTRYVSTRDDLVSPAQWLVAMCADEDCFNGEAYKVRGIIAPRGNNECPRR